MKKICLVLLLILQLTAKDKVGKVIAVEGNVRAIPDGAEERVLKRGSVIFTDELIKVATSSKIQISFTDGSLLNLIPDTEFRVDTYKFKSRGANEYSGRVVTGGLRYLSGEIAKSNPEGTSIQTPTATLGIRGTVLDILVTAGCALAVGCESGNVIVNTATGRLTIGRAASVQFAQSCSENAPIQALEERPANLDLQLFTSPPGAIPTAPTGIVGPSGAATEGATGTRLQGGC